MSLYSFDELQSNEAPSDHDRPFWTINFKDKKEVRDWVVWNWDSLKTRDENRLQNILANMAAYRGITYKIPVAGTRFQDIEPLAKAPRVSVNMIYDAVEQEVSKLTIYRPNVNCNPASNDNDDVTTAHIGDDVLDWAFNREKIDAKIERMQREKKIIGEAFLLPVWDKNRGPLDEDYAKAKKKYGRVPLIGENGEHVTGTDGEPLYVDRPMRQGDFYYKKFYSWEIMFQRKKDYEDAEWAIWSEYVDADALKAEYPMVANEIKASAPQFSPLSPETYQSGDYGHKCQVLHFVHKPTDELAEGWYIKQTRDVILVNDVLPEEWRCEDESGKPDFPWERITDVDPPGCLRGYSTLDFARQLNNLYSNFTTMMARAIFHGAHMKWLVPRGTAKIESLGNGDTVVQYKGGVPPTQVAPNPVSPALWAGRENLKQDFQNVLGSSGVSRGEPPPGVKAWHAIQYLDELENERRNSSISKHNNAIVGLAKKTLRMIGVKYDVKRLEQIIGRAQRGDLKGFDPMKLASIYAIRPQAGSGLARQKSMRVAQVIDLKQTFPFLIPDEEVVNMMGFGDEEGFRNAATVSVSMAEYENEQLLRSKTVKSPEKWESHLIHYGIHRRMLENKTFFLTIKAEAQDEMKKHVEGHEMAMFDAGIKNPAYMAQVLQRYPDFPVFFEYKRFQYPDPLTIIKMGQMPPQMPPQPQSPSPSPAMSPEQQPSITTTGMNPMAENAQLNPAGETAYQEMKA